MRGRPFTLIELMIVISIIGIMTTILMPSLALAREKSKAAVCKSQMRQCGFAINMYLDDWDDWMPATDGHGAKRSQLGWKNSLVLYMDGTDTTKAPFKCPSANLSFNSPNQETGTSYNKEFGDSRFSNWPSKKVNDMEIPTETIVIGDSIDWATSWAVASRLLKPSSSDDPIPVGNRHYQGINLLWGDFSVRWMSQSALRSGKDGNIDYYYLLEK